jgi:hypothetical protein
MRGRKLLAVGASLALLVALAVGMTASGAATGPAEATFIYGFPAGSIVLLGDPDDGTLLAGGFVAGEDFVDADGSGSYSPGEAIYLDSDSSVDVSPGDVRLTVVNGFPAGSIVLSGDPDDGTPLAGGFLSGEDFVDADGSLDYTPGEAIYRDLDGSGDVSPGDVRLTPVGAGVVNAVSPGAFALLERIIVTDNAIGPTFVPLLVEQVCVAMTVGSTIRASEILELRLYRENGVSAGFAGFGPGADDLLGRIPNPTLATLGDTCFGTPGQLLFSVNGINNTASETLYIVAAFAPWAQRGDSLRLTVEMRANDDLTGSGAGQSSRFTNGGSVLVIPSPNSTVISGPAAGALFVIDETDSLIGTAAPGSTVVLQQFSLENQTANLVTIDRITAYATGTPDDSVLANVKRIRLFRERGSTGPGWQEGDELLGTVTRPDLVNGARFGGNRRNLFTIQPNSVQRFYLVIDLDSGTPDGIGIQGAVEVSASSGAMPTDKIVLAAGSLEVEAPAATITVGDVTLSSRGKAKVSVANVPSPGLGSIHGVISFDPEIIQVVSTAQGTYRVRGLGNYLVDDLTVDNNGGTIEFLLILKPGRKPLTGSGDIMEIEFESAPDVNPGDSSPLDVEITDALDASANDLIFNEVSGTARIRIIMGDVDGNGVVTRRDATLLARWLLGRAVLTPIQKKAADVDHSCPSSTDWAALEPGGCVDETDVRWIKEAAAGLRTLSSSANFQVLGRGLTVLMLSSGGLELRAPSAERLSLQVFGLSGQMVFSAESATGTLRFAGVSNRGQRLAKGVYLYVVTLYGRDGSVWRSEVRKLVVK